jgi:hypothetical protein
MQRRLKVRMHRAASGFRVAPLNCVDHGAVFLE